MIFEAKTLVGHSLVTESPQTFLRPSVTASDVAALAPGANAVRAELRAVVHLESEASVLSSFKNVLHLSLIPEGTREF